MNIPVADDVEVAEDTLANSPGGLDNGMPRPKSPKKRICEMAWFNEMLNPRIWILRYDLTDKFRARVIDSYLSAF